MDFSKFKNRQVEDVIDEIKTMNPIVRIIYPRALLDEQHVGGRLSVYVDVHGRIQSLNLE